MTILVAFDGSEDAIRAIEDAARLFPGHRAVVLNVWEPLTVAVAHHPYAALAAAPVDDDDEASVGAARVAERGSQIAREAGLQAEPRADPETNDVPQAILSVADEVEAEAVVLGSRGLRGVRALLGSVSERVAQEAHRPVLIVPS